MDPRDQTVDALTLDWFDSDYGIDSRLVLVHMHDDGQALAQRLRAGLRDHGLLVGEEFDVVGRKGGRALDLKLACGDRIRITENAPALGLTNGDLARSSGSRPALAEMTCACGFRRERRARPAPGRFAPRPSARSTRAMRTPSTRSHGQGMPTVFHFANPRQADQPSDAGRAHANDPLLSALRRGRRSGAGSHEAAAGPDQAETLRRTSCILCGASRYIELRWA